MPALSLSALWPRKLSPIGITRRLRWRAHWRWRADRPFTLRRWEREFTLELANTGASAQVYYQTHSSESLTQVLRLTLREGMTVVDVGAHIGEYTLLAAALVAPGGRVLAVEPQRELAMTLTRNVHANALSNVTVHELALSDGRPARLVVDSSTGGAWLADEADPSIQSIRTTTLHELLAQEGLEHVDLCKLDAAGYEAAVLRGSYEFLRRNGCQLIVYKIYHPAVVQLRQGSDTDCVKLLDGCGYQQLLLNDHTPIRSLNDVIARLGDDWYSMPAVAIKGAASSLIQALSGEASMATSARNRHLAEALLSAITQSAATLRNRASDGV